MQSNASLQKIKALPKFSRALIFNRYYIFVVSFFIFIFIFDVSVFTLTFFFFILVVVSVFMVPGVIGAAEQTVPNEIAAKAIIQHNFFIVLIFSFNSKFVLLQKKLTTDLFYLISN